MDNERYVVLLGASMMQYPALKATEALGYACLVIDGNESAPLMPLASMRAVIDIKNIEKLTLFLDEFTQQHHVAAIFTAGTDFSYVVSTLAERYQLPAHSKQAALAATDKLKMRTLLAQHGVAVPAFFELNKEVSESELKQLLKQHKLLDDIDVVIKPVDSMGARGVMRARSVAEVLQASEQARLFSRSGKVLVEAYLDGSEYSIDALVTNDYIYVHGLADRHIFYPPYFIEMGHTIPSVVDEQTKEAIINEFSKAVRALGLTHGAAKGDIKVTKQGVFIGEIAARLSGGYMSGWTYPLSSGVNVTELALRLALGQSIEQLELELIEQPNVCAERAFISIPGVIQEILYVQEARLMAGVAEVFVRVKVGDCVTFPKNNVEKAGNILAVAQSYEQASVLAEQARKSIFIRLKADEKQTREFLFGRGEVHLASAFIAGRDFNGLNREELLTHYVKITGHDYTSYSAERMIEFERAIDKGGLQGAVWYYDTFGLLAT